MTRLNAAPRGDDLDIVAGTRGPTDFLRFAALEEQRARILRGCGKTECEFQRIEMAGPAVEDAAEIAARPHKLLGFEPVQPAQALVALPMERVGFPAERRDMSRV